MTAKEEPCFSIFYRGCNQTNLSSKDVAPKIGQITFKKNKSKTLSAIWQHKSHTLLQPLSRRPLQVLPGPPSPHPAFTASCGRRHAAEASGRPRSGLSASTGADDSHYFFSKIPLLRRPSGPNLYICADAAETSLVFHGVCRGTPRAGAAHNPRQRCELLHR